MNNKINELNKQLSLIHGNELEIKSLLQKEWNETFARDKNLQDAMVEVQSSTEYCWNGYGEIVSWLRFDLDRFKECSEYLKEYLRDQHVELDANDCITYSQGPCIVINDGGDVYDQDGDKFFVKQSDYKDEDGIINLNKRNELIENYMEKNGYFPSIFRSDRYDNVFCVNTQNKTEK